jgi:glycosyltransferase involved in cell wall biosynthesis
LVFYAKNFIPSLMLLALRLRRRLFVVFEAHTIPTTALQRFVVRHVDGVIANSHALARDLESFRPTESVLPTHQGVDLTPYATSESRDTIRGRLGLPEDEMIAAYTGKIYRGYSEVEYIVQAAGRRECQDVRFVLVGGRTDHVTAWRNEVARRGLQNVHFTGFVTPAEVHQYQLAADVLLLYYPSGIALNAYRSPGKLFAYMASGVPIVAVDLPVLREVLGEPPAARLVPPDSPVALSRAVHEVLAQRESALVAADRARNRVSEFTWERRADQVLAFVEGLRLNGSGGAESFELQRRTGP